MSRSAFAPSAARRSRAVSCLLTASLPTNGRRWSLLPRRRTATSSIAASSPRRMTWSSSGITSASWADGGTSCYGKNGLCAWDAVEPRQLTVYDDTHKTPAWFGRGVTYQIFPDRFRRAKSRDVAGLVGPRTLHENWDELPEYRPNAEGEITCSDFFGGDLQGITEKLDYLASLGVTTLYLCPIFEASTNHRYDTACYERIDPLLGDEADFRTLCAEAKKARHLRDARRRLQPHGAKERLLQRRQLLRRPRRGAGRAVALLPLVQLPPLPRRVRRPVGH